MSDIENASDNNMPHSNIDLLMDVSINVIVELGRAKLSVREILSLGEGSIIELQKLSGEPIDLLVNGKLIAKGEVVVIDESFGVRITDIIDPAYTSINKNQ
ncbi:flagellar motor switch protein FliN [uncultured Brachyspira sp.]|uniref:flagellar motor switch protein FliN n=1 Tax=uncultured Brachyspira sp. TaxID=221953 RepID=UPI0025D173FC|nr:flagellar motor switch protein FliN [uncultured Brachyspira sp.]